MEPVVELASESDLPAGNLHQSHRHYHPERKATKCGHPLHPSAPTHTPYCSECACAMAKSRMDAAWDRLNQNGGPRCAWHLRNTSWKKANLSYRVRLQRWQQAKRRRKLQLEREKAWDEAHTPGAQTQVDIMENTASDTRCAICSGARQPEAFEQASTGNAMAWWERPGALKPHAAPKTPPRPRRTRSQRSVQGSPEMRKFIRHHHATHSAERAERKQAESRWNIESAVRRKHNLNHDAHFDAKFWDSPLSSVSSRRSYESLSANRRMEERRERGNTPRPRPPRSSLSYCESAGQSDVDDETAEQLRAEEEAQERERWERKVQQVGTEVGYLYFVGKSVGKVDGILGNGDGLGIWGDDFLRSDHSLIWRETEHDWSLLDDPMDLDE